MNAVAGIEDHPRRNRGKKSTGISRKPSQIRPPQRHHKNTRKAENHGRHAQCPEIIAEEDFKEKVKRAKELKEEMQKAENVAKKAKKKTKGKKLW